MELTSSVASKALPICGAAMFILLVAFMKCLIILPKSTSDAVVRMPKILEATNRQLETPDKPLNTLSELSKTVSCVHRVGKHAVRSTLVAVTENFSSIKDWVFAGMGKEGDHGERDEVSE